MNENEQLSPKMHDLNLAKCYVSFNRHNNAALLDFDNGNYDSLDDKLNENNKNQYPIKYDGYTFNGLTKDMFGFFVEAINYKEELRACDSIFIKYDNEIHEFDNLSVNEIIAKLVDYTEDELIKELSAKMSWLSKGAKKTIINNIIESM